MITTNQEYWEPVEDALRSFPLEQPPSTLLAGVLRNITPSRQTDTQKMASFQVFSWLDAAISLFFSMMFGLVLLTGRIIPAQMMPLLEWTAKMVCQPIVSIPLLISLLMASSGLLVFFRQTGGYSKQI